MFVKYQLGTDRLLMLAAMGDGIQIEAPALEEEKPGEVEKLDQAQALCVRLLNIVPDQPTEE